MNRLRVTADDFGLHPSVNRGIASLAASGRIDRISVMAHQGACREGLSEMSSGGVELGIHLVFVDEAPLRGDLLGPYLDADGRLPRSYRKLFQMALLDARFPELLAREAEAQMNQLLDEGVKVLHVNSHQHVHLFPPIWRALLPRFQSWRLPVRAAAHLYAGPIKQMLVEAASATALKRHPPGDLPIHHPLGIEMAGRMTRERLSKAWPRIRSVAAAEASAEIVVHPGEEGAGVGTRYSRWGYAWRQEYDTLASGAIQSLMNQVEP